MSYVMCNDHFVGSQMFDSSRILFLGFAFRVHIHDL